MADRPGRPNAVVRWWEGLSPLSRAAIAGPPLAVLLFLANLGPFNQPLWRSILYGVLEGGLLTGILLAVTQSEKRKRDR